MELYYSFIENYHLVILSIPPDGGRIDHNRIIIHVFLNIVHWIRCVGHMAKTPPGDKPRIASKEFPVRDNHCSSTYPCRGLWETGRCDHSHWSSISSARRILGHGRSSPRRPPRSRGPSQAADNGPASPPAPTAGTRSSSHTPSGSWGTPANPVGGRQVNLVYR